MLLRVKCLSHLGLIEQALEEVSRFLMQESYLKDTPKSSEVSRNIGGLDDKDLDSVESQHFACYYMRGKLLMLKQDWKGAIINLNNAQLLKDSELKVFIRRF